MKLYITYKDDGSAGVGGQDSSTFASNKLYILEGTYQEIKDKIWEMESSFSSWHRKNPRFGDFFFEGTDDEGKVDYEDVVYVKMENSND